VTPSPAAIVSGQRLQVGRAGGQMSATDRSFASGGAPDLELIGGIGRVVDAMPDTTEFRPRRSFARQVALGHHLDVAAIADDSGATQRLLVEWAALASDGSD